MFVSFLPAVADDAAKEIRRTIKRWRLHLWSGETLADLAQEINPIVRGWINYYGGFYPSELIRLSGASTSTRAMGDAEIQATARAVPRRATVPGGGRQTRTSTVRSLAGGRANGWMTRAR